MKKAIVTGLNQYLADLNVMYVKLHNLHWNVVGVQFKQVHEYLEELYDGISDALDEVAELIKINNKTPLASMKDYLAISAIEERSSEELSALTVIDITQKDMLYFKKSLEALRKLADEEDQYDVVGMLEDHLSNYNKSLWFLSAMTK